MKSQSITFLLVFLFASSFLNAQIIKGQKPLENVPPVVNATFINQFAGKDVTWFTRFQGRYNDEQVYEGRFLFDNRYSSAVYTKNGSLVAFVTAIEYTEIPKNARDYLDVNFPGRAIIDSVLVTRGGDDVTYEIGIYLDNQFVVKVFSKNGEFIKGVKG